jgi:predicted secreted protein
LKKHNLFLIWVSLVSIIAVSACSDINGKKEETGSRFKDVQEIQEIRPERPVKIKLKRNADGEYSWELNGDNAERVIETDKKLKRYNVKTVSE